MITDEQSPPPGTTGSASAVLEWRSWPVRERPLAGVLAGLTMIAGAILVAAIAGHVVFGVIALVVLMGSLNPFFSPTSFRLDPESVEVRRGPVRKVRPWADIRSCFVDRHGVTLSPFVGKSFLEPYRAVRLLFSGNRAEVLAFLRPRLREDVRFVDLQKASGPGSGGDA